MFHVAQVRRYIHNTAARGRANALLANDHFMTSANHLGFTTSTIRNYSNTPRNLGENREGFATKAIFNHPQGQQMRNAMTDNSGMYLGRALIERNYNAARDAVRESSIQRLERPKAIAAIVMQAHNAGDSVQKSLNAIPGLYNIKYVSDVLTIWRRLE